jgi:hypothetical protein
MSDNYPPPAPISSVMANGTDRDRQIGARGRRHYPIGVTPLADLAVEHMPVRLCIAGWQLPAFAAQGHTPEQAALAALAYADELIAQHEANPQGEGI